MEIAAPLYYKKFKCIADKCKHSCCIGWEIDIDKDTLQKYRRVDETDGESLMSTIAIDGGVASFRMTDEGRCPHLDECGLCKIILRQGEEYLSDICREHPRFYNLVGQRREAGLGMVCEEAARLILSSDDYDEIVRIGRDNDEESQPSPFDAAAVRADIYEILSDTSLEYTERLGRIYERFGTSPAKVSDADWKNLISELEYINEENRALFLSYTSALETKKENEPIQRRALAYFIYRHASPSESEAEFKISLGLALFLERLLNSLLNASEKRDTDTVIELARVISEEIEYCEENTEKIKFEYL